MELSIYSCLSLCCPASPVRHKHSIPRALSSLLLPGTLSSLAPLIGVCRAPPLRAAAVVGTEQLPRTKGASVAPTAACAGHRREGRQRGPPSSHAQGTDASRLMSFFFLPHATSSSIARSFFFLPHAPNSNMVMIFFVSFFVVSCA